MKAATVRKRILFITEKSLNFAFEIDFFVGMGGDHIRSFNPEKIYICCDPDCSIILPSYIALRRHMALHTKEASSHRQSGQEEEEGEEEEEGVEGEEGKEQAGVEGWNSSDWEEDSLEFDLEADEDDFRLSDEDEEEGRGGGAGGGRGGSSSSNKRNRSNSNNNSSMYCLPSAACKRPRSRSFDEEVKQIVKQHRSEAATTAKPTPKTFNCEVEGCGKSFLHVNCLQTIC